MLTVSFVADPIYSDLARKDGGSKSSSSWDDLGQIANYALILSRNSVVKNSTHIKGVWQTIPQHYGLQWTGSRFLDLASVSLKPGPTSRGPLPNFNDFRRGQPSHQGKWYHSPRENSWDWSRTLAFPRELCCCLLHPSLPRLVEQRRGTELRSRTLAPGKPEIFHALESLLDELHASDESKIMQTAPMNFGRRDPPMSSRRKPLPKPCTVKAYPLCQQAGCPYYLSHFSLPELLQV